MNVFCERSGNCTVVTIEGDLCVPQSEKFKEFLLSKIETGIHDLLLDFSLVNFVDSSGISVLLTLLQHARKRGGDVRLTRASDRLNDIFKQVGLHHVFRRFKQLNEGVASFDAGATLEPA